VHVAWRKDEPELIVASDSGGYRRSGSGDSASAVDVGVTTAGGAGTAVVARAVKAARDTIRLAGERFMQAPDRRPSPNCT
jgi:hypothetical protein